MKDPYSVLGISPSATDEEVKNDYRNLARKYHPDNYDDDNPLKELANEKMQDINAAYDEILASRAGGSGAFKGDRGESTSYYSSAGATGIYYEIRQKINSRRYAEAERLIADIPISDRNADWHYLNSVLLMNRGNVNDAMRELEMACSMDPGNMEYQKAKEMFNTNTRGYGSTYYDNRDSGRYRRRTTTDDACDCCANLICLDCLCECFGGDFISCI